jgi:hypothetical protein
MGARVVSFSKWTYSNEADKWLLIACFSAQYGSTNGSENGTPATIPGRPTRREPWRRPGSPVNDLLSCHLACPASQIRTTLEPWERVTVDRARGVDRACRTECRVCPKQDSPPARGPLLLGRYCPWHRAPLRRSAIRVLGVLYLEEPQDSVPVRVRSRDRPHLLRLVVGRVDYPPGLAARTDDIALPVFRGIGCRHAYSTRLLYPRITASTKEILCLLGTSARQRGNVAINHRHTTSTSPRSIGSLIVSHR